MVSWVRFEGSGETGTRREGIFASGRGRVRRAGRGPEEAFRFLAAFEEAGGAVREGVRGPDPQEYADGTLLYRSGDLEDTTFRDHLDLLCAEDPPDLLHSAGRSADFTAFHDYSKATAGTSSTGAA
ncbi:hypothetical protein ACFWTE_06780 [Nocardiopsis sp. NPDC058631]|uniref:hypothetical protein n=1 Tax=Nocardiopsis sp. NPDC058631 TaxID=3346566 RepID=UPI00365E54B9